MLAAEGLDDRFANGFVEAVEGATGDQFGAGGARGAFVSFARRRAAIRGENV